MPSTTPDCSRPSASRAPTLGDLCPAAQSGRQGTTPQLARSDFDTGPRLSEQRQFVDMLSGSRRQTAQRQLINGLFTGRVTQCMLASTASEEAHSNALKNHADDRQALRDELETMAQSSDARTKNTARWFQAGRSKLFALTPTADSEERAKAAGQEGKLAMFGAGQDVLVDAANPGYVTDDLQSNADIRMVERQSGGFRLGQGGSVFITQPARRAQLNEELTTQAKGTFDPIADSLRHEVQHEADVNFNADIRALRDPDGPEYALAQYCTEFRAYTAQASKWLQEDLTSEEKSKLRQLGVSDAPEKKDVVKMKILVQIVPNYPVVRNAWDQNSILDSGSDFKNAVLAMNGTIDEISGNPDNNPDVADLWTKLNPLALQDRGNDKEILRLAATLTPRERAAMLQQHKRWKNQSDEYPWFDREVEVVLSENPMNFGLEINKYLIGIEAERQMVERSKPPPFSLISALLPSWGSVRKMLDSEGLSGHELIEEDYEEWSGFEFKGKYVDIFFMNTAQVLAEKKQNWWDVFDRLRAEKDAGEKKS